MKSSKSVSYTHLTLPYQETNEDDLANLLDAPPSFLDPLPDMSRADPEHPIEPEEPLEPEDAESVNKAETNR